MSSSNAPRGSERLPASMRREATLLAARAVFAQSGYYGTSTERIAEAAQISQPYVVRMFGSKENLFLAVVEQCLDATLAAFEEALEAVGEGSVPERLGAAYLELATARDVHLITMQAYLLGADPVIGPVARTAFSRVVDFLVDDAHLTATEAQSFMERGMLINTLLALRFTDDAPVTTSQLIAQVLSR